MIGIVDLNHNSEFIESKMLFRSLVGYTLQNLINCCGERNVFIYSLNDKHQDIAFNYGISFKKEDTSSITLNLKSDVIVLNGMNPIFIPELKELKLNQQSIKFLDIQHKVFGYFYNIDSDLNILKEIVFPLERGLSIENDIEFNVNEALLKSKSTFPNLPIEVNPSYNIEVKENDGKPRVLFSAPYQFFNEDVRHRFESLFSIVYAYNAPKSIVVELIKDVEIWITSTCPPYFIDEEIYKFGKKLKIVASPSTGVTHMDTGYLYKNNIKLCTIKSSDFIKNIKASSESTFALLLAMIKKMNQTLEQTKYAMWRENETENRSIELHSKSIGIIGYGRIGSNLARYCNVFGMKVNVFDPFITISDDFVNVCSDKKELLQKSNIVSLCYHYSEETDSSFTFEDFNHMCEGSYFLNTARGELVEEGALLGALKSGHLKAAAIDVIRNESESNKWSAPLIEYARSNANLLINPHVAGLTVDSESKAALEILNEILNVLNRTI